jgi:heat shock protein HslJ
MQWNLDVRHISGAWRGSALLAALVLAGCASGKSTSQPSIVGLWVAQEVAGAPVPSDANVTLAIYDDGRAVGRAGCNNYSSKFTRSGDSIAFGPTISTKMACTPELMDLEQSYLSTLDATTRVERLPDGALVLSTDDAKQILLRRQESSSLQEARARGVDFRAIGQEPGWVVELKEDDQITALLDYGATSLVLPTPRVDTAEDGTVTYDTSTDTDHLLLSIRDKICIDSMSGEAHPSTVQLIVNDKSYQGCGNWLD